MDALTLPIKSRALEAEVAAVPLALRADARSEAWVAHCQGSSPRAVVRAVHNFRRRSARRAARVMSGDFPLDRLPPSRIRLVI